MKKIFNLVIDGILVGSFGGVLSTLYVYFVKIMFSYSEKVFSKKEILFTLFILAVFVIIAFVLHKLLEYEPSSGGSGIPLIKSEVLDEVITDERKIIYSKFLSGGFTSFAGMSLGASGPSIHIASSASKFISKILKRSRKEQILMIKAGAGVGLAVAYNAPLASVLFVLEEIQSGFSKSVAFITIIATVIASKIATLFMGSDAFVTFSEVEPISMRYFPYLILLGIFTAIVGSIFNMGTLFTQRLFSDIKIKPLFKMLGVLLTSFIMGYFLSFTTGTGGKLLQLLRTEESTLYVLIGFLVVKVLYTWISYGSGVSGGLFFPILIIGGITGLAFANVFGIKEYLINFIFLGMSGLMVSSVGAIFLGIALILEMTHSMSHVLSITIVALSSLFFSRIMKTKPINLVFYENLRMKIKNVKK